MGHDIMTYGYQHNNIISESVQSSYQLIVIKLHPPDPQPVYPSTASAFACMLQTLIPFIYQQWVRDELLNKHTSIIGDIQQIHLWTKRIQNRQGKLFNWLAKLTFNSLYSHSSVIVTLLYPQFIRMFPSLQNDSATQLSTVKTGRQTDAGRQAGRQIGLFFTNWKKLHQIL